MHVGMEFARESDFSATLTQDEFAKNLKPLLASPQLGEARQETISIQDIKLRQRKPGELRRLATVSRPDFCDRLARLASRANSSLGRDAYRSNGLVKTANVWRQAVILKNSSSSHVGKSAQELDDGEMRKRGEEIHGARVGRSGAIWSVGRRIWG